MTPSNINPDLDLVLDRVIDVPVHKVWAAWTKPELIVQWFTPAPWKTVEANIDLRPGGRNNIIMQSPEGENFPNIGTYLEVIENKRLTFTSVLGEDFRPLPHPENGAMDMPFTASIILEDLGNGKTRYIAHARHATPAGCKQHADMGFHAGWGAALDQLIALMKTN
jgi:uncharacterized protein YndB with AHSA1/START domain